jgi:hypothetical protein
MKVVRILSDRPTERVRHSNGKTVSESGHLISVTIRIALVSGNSKLNFYDPSMMNITIRHKIYCSYPYSIREFCSRKKNYLYLYLQYPFISETFSSLFRITSLTKNPQDPRFTSISKFDYHVRAQAALGREHSWSVSFNSAKIVHFTHNSCSPCCPG